MSATRSRRSERGTRSSRPIMGVLDWLGRRWTLRVLWELRDGALPFRGLQEHCGGLSPTVLNDRLRELRAAGVFERQEGGGYALTADGRSLGEILLPLHVWAERWARRAGTRRAP